MRAMVLERPGSPLVLREVDRPSPGRGQVLLRVEACAVCRTDLHVADGELTRPKLPLILGHEIVGTVEAVGEGSSAQDLGTRLGVPWLGWTCGTCEFCARGEENLCPRARFTGYTIDGGFAEYTVADRRYCFPVPSRYPAEHAAPLLCAGLIGYRSYRLAGAGTRLGLYGFGAAAHLLAQLARAQGREVYAFVRQGDEAARQHALSLGVEWAGWSTERPPRPLDAAILFAPVGALVPEALRSVRPGGSVVCGGIHMSDIPAFPYALLWEERSVRSVANLTRRDAEEFLAAAGEVEIRSDVQAYPLEAANEALQALRRGEIRGAAVLRVASGRGGAP